MPQEYQVIEHNYYRGLNLFLSRLYYRAPHYHRECELMMALEGEADIIFSNGKVSRLTAGNVAVLGPMELHEMRSGEDGVLLITIQTSFAVLEYFLSHRISPFYAVDTDISQFMTEQERQTLRNICYELALAYPGMPEDDAGECFILQAKLINFLIKLLPKSEGKGDENKMTKMRAGTISRILQYVDENFQKKLTLGELAERENLSLSYLSHAFKDAMGISFQEYLKQKRFENASRLLQSSEMNLLDISIASGFSDVRYMMKAFSEIAGCSPAEYRRSFRDYSEENSRVAEINQYYLTREEACRKLMEYKAKYKK
jgi:AraC-like DNA-binding protein